MQRPFFGARNLPNAANPGNPAPTRGAATADDDHKIPVKVNSHNHPDELPVSRELRASAEVVRAHLRAGFLHAGRELSRAKLTCRHGEWLPYLQLCEVPPRWAQRMMQAARAIDSGEVPEDLSLNATLLAIAEKRQTPSHLPAPAEPWEGQADFDLEREREQYFAWLCVSYTPERAWTMAHDDHGVWQWWLEGAPIRALPDAKWDDLVDRIKAKWGKLLDTLNEGDALLDHMDREVATAERAAAKLPPDHPCHAEIATTKAMAAACRADHEESRALLDPEGDA